MNSIVPKKNKETLNHWTIGQNWTTLSGRRFHRSNNQLKRKFSLRGSLNVSLRSLRRCPRSLWCVFRGNKCETLEGDMEGAVNSYANNRMRLTNNVLRYLWQNLALWCCYVFTGRYFDTPRMAESWAAFTQRG